MSDAIFLIRIVLGMACLVAWVVVVPFTSVQDVAAPDLIPAIALPVAGFWLISQR